jgi:molybdopterin molybdotransferase
MLTVKEAQILINQQAKNFGVENSSIENAQGRVLAESIFADRDYPPFNRAAMDGYAINANDFIEKGIRDYTIVEEIYAGSIATEKISEGDCYKIMTGSATPLDADTIIRVEDTEQFDKKVVFKIEQLKTGQNIAKRGEDKKEGDLVFKKGTKLYAPEIATLAVLGKKDVLVYRLPIVSIISTGDEVISIDQPILSHQIRDSNSYALEGFLKNYNIKITNRKLVPDNKELLTQTITEFIYSDILILSGGVSMGDADYVPEVLNSLRIEKVFHKVAIKPGKPLWFGKSKNGVVFALPGNPMSVQVAYKIFIEPFLRKCFGLTEPPFLKLPMAVGRKKKVKFDEFFPCAINNEEISSLRPSLVNGSGDVTAALYSEGIALQEAEREELKKGDIVKFYYW